MKITDRGDVLIVEIPKAANFVALDQLGTDVLKSVLTDFFTLVDGLGDLLGKFNAAALLKVAGVLARYEKPGAVFSAAWAQFRDLDEAEADEVWQHATQAFDIEDDELEARIERVMRVPVLGYAEVLDTIETIAEIGAIWKDPNRNFYQKTRDLFKMQKELFDQGEDVVEVVIEAIKSIRELATYKRA